MPPRRKKPLNFHQRVDKSSTIPTEPPRSDCETLFSRLSASPRLTRASLGARPSTEIENPTTKHYKHPKSSLQGMSPGPIDAPAEPSHNSIRRLGFSASTAAGPSFRIGSVKMSKCQHADQGTELDPPMTRGREKTSKPATAAIITATSDALHARATAEKESQKSRGPNGAAADQGEVTHLGRDTALPESAKKQELLTPPPPSPKHNHTPDVCSTSKLTFAPHVATAKSTPKHKTPYPSLSPAKCDTPNQEGGNSSEEDTPNTANLRASISFAADVAGAKFPLNRKQKQSQKQKTPYPSLSPVKPTRSNRESLNSGNAAAAVAEAAAASASGNATSIASSSQQSGTSSTKKTRKRRRTAASSSSSSLGTIDRPKTEWEEVYNAAVRGASDALREMEGSATRRSARVVEREGKGQGVGRARYDLR